ncbi:MAG TPA: HD domain-containing phosphohydrolase [Blastocatellia bacterium]|nr:HD domain-containing phosphohydrolase [Blastocatellia bacterium]
MEAPGKTREDAISRLAQSIDAFEKHNEPHSALMSELATRLARRMGLVETDVAAISEAARLHDLGLFAMSPTYHSLPGPLSFEQRMDLWRHSVVGEQQMAKREAGRHQQLLVRWHHEWWNGTGYPDQLAFEDIPIGARIIRAVELFSALLSERPYRAALNLNQAMEVLGDSAGVECDPYVVAALSALLRELPVEGSDEPAVENTHATGGYSLNQSGGAMAGLQQPDGPMHGIDHESTDELQFNPHTQVRSETRQPEKRSKSELLLDALRKPADPESPTWTRWSASRYNRKTLLGFEASVLRQIEFNSIAIPYWSGARLDWYLKTWGKQILANDPSRCAFIAARASVEAVEELSEEQIATVLEDAYVPGSKLNNPELTKWFGEMDACWMDNIRRNVDRLNDDVVKAQAMLIAMQAGDYARSFDATTREFRRPLTTVFWRLAGRTITVKGHPSNGTANLPAEDFLRQTRADLLYIKLPPEQSWTAGSKSRSQWRESWVTAGAAAPARTKSSWQSRTAYLATIERLFRCASHFRFWAIGYQETGMASAHEIAELIKQHRPIRATYSKDVSEVLGGLRSYIIVADKKTKL